MEHIGKRIELLLKEKGYSQKELAGMVGVTEAAMSRYLSCEREPKLEVIANLATALDTTSDYLINGTQPEEDFQNIYRLVARTATTMDADQKMRLMKVLLGK